MTGFLSKLPLAVRFSAGSALLCAPSLVNWVLAAEEGRRLTAVAADGKGEAVIAALRTAGDASLYFSGVAIAGSMVLTAVMTWAAVKAEAGLTRALERLSSGEYSALAIPPWVRGGRTARAVEACRIALVASQARAEQGAAEAEAERRLRESARLESEAERRTVMAALAAGLAALAAARRGVELGFEPQAGVAMPRRKPLAASEANRVKARQDGGEYPPVTEIDELRALLRRLGSEGGEIRTGVAVAPTRMWAS